MKTISATTVYALDNSRAVIEFSPLDLFARGHFTIGMIFGFRAAIDPERFRNSLQQALSTNPEMGVAIRIMEDGRHVLERGHGIEFIVQEHAGAAPPRDAINGLPLDQFPLACTSIGARELIENALPLVGFRITRFADGLYTLGARMTHSHLDGTALMHFLANICAIYRGEQTVPQTADRGGIAKLACGNGLTPSDALPIAPPLTLRDRQIIAEQPKCICNNISVPNELLHDFIEQTRLDARELSSSDILCALVWKAWALASPLPPQRKARLYGHFNIRPVADLGIAKNYQGNALIDRRAELTFAQVRTLPIVELARQYRQQTKPLDQEDLRRDIAYLARLQRERAYDSAGKYTHFTRGFDIDGPSGRALAVNDVRLMNFEQIKLGGTANWYELAGNIEDRYIVELSRRGDDTTIIRYVAPPKDGNLFKEYLEDALTHSFQQRAFGPLNILMDCIELHQSY